MNGLELLEAINNSNYLREKSIPFVFLTTSAQPDVVKRAYEYAIQGIFLKPIRLNDMKALLQGILFYWDKSKHPNN